MFLSSGKVFLGGGKKCLLSEEKYFSKEIQAGEKERKRKTNMAVILGWLLHVHIFRESTFGEKESYKQLWRLLQDYFF